MESTIIEIVISEAQNEVRDFAKWGFDIIPHRMVMKTGFQTPDGKRVPIEDAFKDPQHPFRIAIVCAMWLTGFDVECLATLYIDKPMKAHNLMQAIARANRVFPGKDCGVIVDYNGMLKSLREALAQDALYTSDEAKRRFEIMARQVFIRFKALLMEPSALAYAERHDNIEAIYKKLQDPRHRRRDRGAQGVASHRQRGHTGGGAGRGLRS